MNLDFSWQSIRLHPVIIARFSLFYFGSFFREEVTELGRFAGQAGVEVESVVRLVAALRGNTINEIDDPTLIAATQLTVELNDVSFPINKKSTQKEPQTWFGEIQRQGVASVAFLKFFDKVSPPF